MNEMKAYLDGKELGYASEDMEVSSDAVKMEHELHMPNSFECKITWKIGYGMDNVDDMRRWRWCNSYRRIYRHGGQ